MPLHVRLYELIRVARALAEEKQQRYTGFIAMSGDHTVHSFTRTRYPRRKYGIPTIADCEDGMQALATALKTKVEADPQHEDFRVVLGLREGYNPHNPRHSLAEVIKILGSSYHIEGTSIFAALTTPVGSNFNHEPAVIIRGAMSDILPVFDLAERFSQERFTVEVFNAGLAYVVETGHCTDPDPQ